MRQPVIANVFETERDDDVSFAPAALAIEYGLSFVSECE